MTEKQIVDQTLKPGTAASLELDLKKLGIQEGDVLLVHSSMSNLGWICGGVQSVIMALMGAVSAQGTLVMPTQTGDLSDPALWENPAVPEAWWPVIYESMPVFHKDRSPCHGMGRIPETFRKYQGVLRSAHPLTSFAAWGKEAKSITRSHPLTPALGEGSPLERLYQLEAKVLLLGVRYDASTCFHLGEAKWEGMPREKKQIPWMQEGDRYWKEFEDFAYDAQDFSLLGMDFEKIGGVKKGSVGQAGCRLFSLTKAVDFAQEWLGKNRKRAEEWKLEKEE